MFAQLLEFVTQNTPENRQTAFWKTGWEFTQLLKSAAVGGARLSSSVTTTKVFAASGRSMSCQLVKVLCSTLRASWLSTGTRQCLKPIAGFDSSLAGHAPGIPRGGSMQMPF